MVSLADILQARILVVDDNEIYAIMERGSLDVLVAKSFVWVSGESGWSTGLSFLSSARSLFLGGMTSYIVVDPRSAGVPSLWKIDEQSFV